VEHDLGLGQFALAHAIDELALVQVVGDLAVDQVAELVGAREVVDGEDVALAAIVERLDVVGADETGGAGDDDLQSSLPTNRGSPFALIQVSATSILESG
jgi:hypothetical protein